MDKDKKRTLTISSDLRKKIDTSGISSTGKKSYSFEKKNLINYLNQLTNKKHQITYLII